MTAEPQSTPDLTPDLTPDQVEAFARCKRLDNCAEWLSLTWRFAVPDAAKLAKTKGNCLCEQHALHFCTYVKR